MRIHNIGRELNVETVLEGSVRKAGDRLRITAQLVDTTYGHQLWSERYDRDVGDIFAIQDEIINVNRNLEGDRHDNVDNVRIFNFALTLEDIIRLPAIPTAPADLNGDGIVDQTDKDIVQANIGPEKLWP